MSLDLKNIKVVGFDLDGTLYPGTSEINGRVRDKISEYIFEKKPELESLLNARAYFEERYQELESGLKILKEIGYKDTSEIINACLAQADVLDLIEENKYLEGRLKEIRNKYEELYLLTRSNEDLSLKKLERIGINPNIFSYKLYQDTPNVGSKSSGEAFDYVLNLSEFPASQHAYVGDREKSDILPAKQKGIYTIAVQKRIKSADNYISTINEIGDILL